MEISKPTGILVLEDNPLILLDIEHFLEQNDVENVHAVTTLEDAWRVAQTHQDIPALLDIDIDGKPSFELAHEIEKAGRKIAFLTGYSKHMDMPASLENVPVLRKPFGKDEFKMILHYLFSVGDDIEIDRKNF
jgi:DNA-binding response OmpR family regulator